MELQNPSKVSQQTITKAVEALLNWKSSSKSHNPQLLPSDDFLYLILSLNKIPPKPRTNAFKIPLPHPLYTPQTSEICLFVHDSISKDIKNKVSEGVVPVSKVIKLTKLRSDYKAFEQKRKLCDSYDLFFADKRIVPLLPKSIGKDFYRKKKVPVPIELGRGDLKGKIEKACGSAMLYLGSGSCCVVKVGKAAMSKGEIVENVVAAVEGIVGVVPKKWENVRGFHLKFSESVALPVYQKVPELGMKIVGLSGFGVVEKEKGEENVVVAAKEGKRGKKGKEKVVRKKGRIHEVRYLDEGGMVGDDEDEDEDEVEDELIDKEVIEDVDNVGKKKKNIKKVEKGMVEDDEDEGEGEDEEVNEEVDALGKKRKKVKKVEKVKKGVKGLKEKNGKSLMKKSKRSKVLV